MKYRYLALSLLTLALTLACSTRSAAAQNPRLLGTAKPKVLGSVVATEGRSVALPGRPAARRSRKGSEDADPDALARAVLAEVNAVRRRAGARPLRADAALTRAAARYAQELASRREIEHVSRTPGRRTFRQRIAAAGGRARIAGENLARMTASPSSLPERAVRAWMRSPGHRANMLDRSYARTGIGVWLGRDGVWYVVQEFATAD